MRSKLLLLFFSIGISLLHAQSFFYGDFEKGIVDSCSCPDDFNCFYDAGWVCDGFHKLYKPNLRSGCTINKTSLSNSLNAYSGKSYVYMYGGKDYIESRKYLLNTCEIIKICTWYSGPQGLSDVDQKNAFFRFGIDGKLVGPNFYVPVNTKWTKACFIDTLTAGNHSFSIHSGVWGQLAMWFDDFSVEVIGKSSCPVSKNMPDTTVCGSTPFLLNATTPNCNYLWQDGGIKPVVAVKHSGQYWVDVSNNCCTVRDSVKVNFLPIPKIDLGSDTLLCLGDTLVINPSMVGQITWQDGSTDSSRLIYQTGTYSVTVTKNNCSNSDAIQVDFLTAPIVDLGIDTAICAGTSIILDASYTASRYSWQDWSTLPTYIVQEQGMYIVYTENLCGSMYDSIQVDLIDCDCFALVPEAFSPNGDNNNDLLRVYGNCVKDIQFVIYDRWGEKVFEATTLAQAWDGTYKGRLLDSGVFIYALEATSTRDERKIQHKGSISLIR